MLRFVSGNLFDSQAQTLVNTVNCVGVMGKGIALEFKNRFPVMFRDYKLRCIRGEIKTGVLTIYCEQKPWIVNFPTKRDWRNDSHIEDVEAGLLALSALIRRWQIDSLAMPALGCGNGNLDWSKVKLLIEKHLAAETIDIEVYEPM